MSSDRARISHDLSRHWRGVISQQGRVALEADANEANAIAAERSRAQLLEIVGPAGAPLVSAGDPDGYSVTAVTDSGGAFTGDLTIGAGALYVGGERVVLDADVEYSGQPDWLDTDADSLWVDVEPPAGGTNEIVYLLLREQEVGAVEDPALLDVALGGPDTSERVRIVQHVVRQTTTAAPVSATDPFGDADLVAKWTSLGLQLDAPTMRLMSSAALQVEGAYLGAENQLVRVQIASVDPQTGAPTLVWGFDNAHYLHRVVVDSTNQASGTTTLTLSSQPVDVYHQPRAGQAVELLEAAARLDSSDYIAAAAGVVTTVTPTGGYQPDTQQLVVSTPVTAPPTQLFVRVWEDTVVYTGQAVALGDTGLQVSLTLSPTAGGGTSAYHVGDYWQFAVRAGSASAIYPERILDAAQPPDGPRLWACPLAVVDWAASPPVTDCRQPFDSLVDARTATHISYSPSCEVLQGAETVADALNILCEHAEQGNDFPMALLRLFGRGVVCGLIPSIQVNPPASGATDVQVTITVTDGTVIDGRGELFVLSTASGGAPAIPPLQTTVPLAFSGPGTPTDVERWLYLVTGSPQPPGSPQTPTLELRTAPPDSISLPSDVLTALANPASGPVIPPNLNCQQSEQAAWQAYSDVPCVTTNDDGAVCLGAVGVQGSAGWTVPDDREQVFPTPAVTAALWDTQRQQVYELVKQACIAAPVNLQQVVLGQQSLNGQALLSGTKGRTATIVLDGAVHGSALTVSFTSSPGVTVHGPIAIAPGQSSGSFTFDIGAAGALSITASIDTGTLQAAFTGVQVQAPTLAGGAHALMTGDTIGVSFQLSSPASESLTITPSSSGVKFTPPTIQIAAGASSGSGQLSVTPPLIGAVTLIATVQVTGGLAGTAPPSLQFTSVGLAGIVVNPSTVTIGQPASATVSLTAPAPYAVTLAISSGNSSVLAPGASSTSIVEGSVSSGALAVSGEQQGATTLTAARSTAGVVVQQVTTNVNVQPKAKETKEGKDTKDTKEGKEHKDGKDVKEGKEAMVGAEKAQLDTPAPAVEEALEPNIGDSEEPQGHAFVPSDLRPTLGQGAFDPPAGGNDS